MCRLILMNKAGEREIEREYGLARYLEYLEQSLGGHGNGFALLRDNKIIKLEKAMNLDVKDIAKVLKRTPYEWAIFHTRLASIGGRSDKNCHPFRRNDMVMAMNGTESAVGFLSNVLDKTDTETILDLIDKYHLGISVLKRFSSIFVGFDRGTPFVVSNNTYNIKLLHDSKSNATVFASAFPEEMLKYKNIYSAHEDFMWHGGELDKENFTKQTKSKVRKYYNPKYCTGTGVSYDLDEEDEIYNGQYYLEDYYSVRR